ncbi:VOC family protein [Novosphingobium aquimarinum]|uniref:VOC family protein n=1 Tax=Novosphingobium aquimarinum TaxID=2682494 RepID=UPI001E2A31B5|nr:VOC family protein [Novosphingobium aquimarinum]
MAPIPGVPSKQFMQIAFVVEDLHESCREWIRATGIGPFLEVPHIVLEEFDYRGIKSTGLDFSVAIAQSGGVQIELIEQHGEVPSAYRDTIAKGQSGFHHLAIYTDAYDHVYARYMDEGFLTAVNGTFGGYRFSYIDTSPAIGCMVELIEANSLQGDFFARIAAAADGWDGKTDPIRPGFPSDAK